MIGFYNYSVIMTYIGLSFSIFGMTQAIEGKFRVAVFCLALSGLCDMFDGKIARAMKNRTEDEKKFGIQIDSLCDMVCFGAFPAVLAYSLGVNSILGKITLILYVLGAVIRLGYFNVMEDKRQQETSEARKYYQGLPVTSIAVIFPIVYLAKQFCKAYFVSILNVTLFVVALLFVTNFKFRKPNNKILTLLVLLVAIVLGKVFHLY